MPITDNLKALFRKHNLPIEPAVTYWSQVDDGWIPLIDKLITDLLAVGWNGQIHQIKEKFGGLRFYTGEITPEQGELISRAEELSYVTCERCGCAGKTTNYITLCTECKKLPYTP